MKEWQFNVLFFVGVGGAILLLIGPSIGLSVGQNPTTITGVGAILTYILTQKTFQPRSSKKKDDEDQEGGEDDNAGEA